MNHIYQLLLLTLSPLLKENLLHTEWQVKDAAIYALGSMTEDCEFGTKFHLAEFVPFLIESCLSEEEIVLRVTRYTTLESYVESNVIESGNEKYFKPLLDAILKGVLDDEKHVKFAAHSAWSTVLDR